MIQCTQFLKKRLEEQAPKGARAGHRPLKSGLASRRKGKAAGHGYVSRRSRKAETRVREGETPTTHKPMETAWWEESHRLQPWEDVKSYYGRTVIL